MRWTEKDLLDYEKGKKKKTYVITEKDLTKQIRQVLTMARVWHWKHWGGPMSYKGVSDILGMWNGRMLAIEVKRPGGLVTADQHAFINRVKTEGGIAFVARSVEDVIENLELKGKVMPLFK